MYDTGISAPLAVGISLIGFKDFVLATRRNDWFYHRNHSIDRDVVILPLVVLEEYPEYVNTALMPVFDSV